MAPVTTELKVLVKAIGKGEIKELEASLQKLAVTARTKVDTNFKQVGAELRKIQSTSVRSIQNLRDYRNAWRDIASQLDVSSKEFRDARAEAARLDRELAKIEGRRTRQVAASGGLGGRIAGTIAGALSIGAGMAAAGSIAQSGIERIESERRLQILAATYGEVDQAQRVAAESARLFGQSQTETNEAIASAYARLRPLGVSLADISSVYNGFNTAARLSGATAQETSAAFTQLAQALGSGVLRGDEFNSIAEQAPGLLQAISQELGVATGELRDYAKEGKITSDVVINALKAIERDGAESLSQALNGPRQKLKDLQNEVENLTAEVGRLALPAIIDLVKILTEETRKWTEFTKDLGDAYFYVSEKIKPFVNGLNQVWWYFKNLTPPGWMMQGVNAFSRNLPGFIGGMAERGRQIQQEQFIGPPTPEFYGPGGAPLPSSPLPLRTTSADVDEKKKSTAQKIKEISQAEYELRKQILQAKVEGREIDVIGFETQLKMLNIQESNLGAMAKEVAIMEVLRAADEKLLKLEEQRSQQSLESYFNAQKALEEENALYEQQKFKILETSIAVGAISEEEGKRLEKQMKIKDIAAEYKVDLEAATKIYERQNKTIKQQEDIWKSIGEAIKSGVGSAIESLIFEAKSLQESLSGILRSVASLLIQYGTKTLFSSFGFANGGIMTGRGPLELKSYARGGVARSPQLAMFGEGSLPEAYVPLPDGRSIPVTMRGGGGAGNIVVNVDAKGTQVEGDNNRSRQLGGAISAAVQAELIKQQRPGGLLNR